MIIVRVELWSARTGVKSEIACMTICNVGGSHTLGDYEAATLKGRDAGAFKDAMLRRRHTRTGRVERHPRLREHVWNLVAKALAAMHYGGAA